MPKWSEFNKPQAPLPQGPTISEMIQTEVQKQVFSLLPSMQQNNTRVQAKMESTTTNFPSISTKVSTLCCKKQQQQEHKPNNKV